MNIDEDMDMDMDVDMDLNMVVGMDDYHIGNLDCNRATKFIHRSGYWELPQNYDSL